jgi:mRNA-degrading endonuclease YafQ of YafQ-DinJ toxin-antitoxin module
MYRIVVTNRYDKDIVKCAKRGLDLDLLEELVNHLKDDGNVPKKTQSSYLIRKHAGLLGMSH